MPPHRILLPYDGGAAARRALAVVADHPWVLRREAEVLLLNVQRVHLDAELSSQVRVVARLHRLEGEAVLRPAAKRLAELSVPHRALVSFGRPVEAIVATAAREQCDLIVMGARLRHPLAELIGGSVARDVMRRSRVPVMPIADPRWDSARPALEGAFA